MDSIHRQDNCVTRRTSEYWIRCLRLPKDSAQATDLQGLAVLENKGVGFLVTNAAVSDYFYPRGTLASVARFVGVTLQHGLLFHTQLREQQRNYTLDTPSHNFLGSVAISLGPLNILQRQDRRQHRL